MLIDREIAVKGHVAGGNVLRIVWPEEELRSSYAKRCSVLNGIHVEVAEMVVMVWAPPNGPSLFFGSHNNCAMWGVKTLGESPGPCWGIVPKKGH